MTEGFFAAVQPNHNQQINWKHFSHLNDVQKEDGLHI